MASKENSFTIFIVEDDIWFAEILEYHLSMNPDYRIEKFATGKECLSNLHKKPDVVCIDYNLDDMTGKRLLKEIMDVIPDISVIVISGQKDLQVAIDLLKIDNVEDYLIKDDDTKDRLWKSILKVRERSVLKKEVISLREELGQKYDFKKTIKGNSSEIQSVFKLMQKACDNSITVSINGETGTGKELVSKCIHYNSTRSKKPFVAVNMNAIPKELAESELFGHEKGAFTGAHNRRIGKFEEAHKGTLFLDEIADMDLTLQSKLLRVLQEKEVTRIGSNRPVKVDVRIIVATHKSLEDEVRKGNFREDLYYRLLGLTVKLPPLRERKSDILVLSKHFSDAFCKENEKEKKGFSEEARKKLQGYAFPGNIRELKAIIELACVMSDGNEISPQDISFSSMTSFTDFINEDITLKGYIAKVIRHFLDKFDNDVPLVAKKLDMGKSTLYRMIKDGEV